MKNMPDDNENYGLELQADGVIEHSSDKEGAISPLLVQDAISVGEKLADMGDREFSDEFSGLMDSLSSTLGRLRFETFLRRFGRPEVTESEPMKLDSISKRLQYTPVPEMIRIRNGVVVEPEDSLNPEGLIAISFVGEGQRKLREALSFPDVPNLLREEFEVLQERFLEVIIDWLNGEKDNADKLYDDVLYEMDRMYDALNILIGEQGLDRLALFALRLEADWENAVLALRNSQDPFKERNWDIGRISFKARDLSAAFRISESELGQGEDFDDSIPSGYPLNFISIETKDKINTLFSSVGEAMKALQEENSIEAVLEMALLAEKILVVSRDIMRLNLGRGYFFYRKNLWNAKYIDWAYKDLLSTLNPKLGGASASQAAAEAVETVEVASLEEENKPTKSVETLVKEARKKIKSARESGKNDEEMMAIYENYIEQIRARLDQMTESFSSYMAVQSIGLHGLNMQRLSEEDFDSSEVLNREEILSAVLALRTLAGSEKVPENYSFRVSDFAELASALQTLIPSLSPENLVYATGKQWSEVEGKVPFSSINWILSEATSDEIFFWGINNLGEQCVLTVKVADENKPGVAEPQITSWEFQTYKQTSDMPEDVQRRIKTTMQDKNVREALKRRKEEASLKSDLALIVMAGALAAKNESRVPLPGAVSEELKQLTKQLEIAARAGIYRRGLSIKISNLVEQLSSLYAAIRDMEDQPASKNPPGREKPEELARWYIHEISRYLRGSWKFRSFD